MSLDPGQLSGVTVQNNYHIEALLGEGGMAYVYKARHRVLQGPVAIKVLQRKYAARDDFRERFLREARLQYQLHHPHIVRVLDFIEDQGLVGCVQEWCDGGELTPQILANPGGLPLTLLKAHFFPLLDAIGEVHQRGYIHRDIKPQNILLQTQEERVLWKISDFGLLKDLGAEDITQSGAIIGTLHYISPEQFEESKDVDCRTDVYSLGVVLYQLLFGRVPFPAKMPRLAMQIIEAPVPLPAECPPALREVLLCAMAKRPAARYPDCGAFKDALTQAIDASLVPATTLAPTLPTQASSQAEVPVQLQPMQRPETRPVLHVSHPAAESDPTPQGHTKQTKDEPAPTSAKIPHYKLPPAKRAQAWILLAALLLGSFVGLVSYKGALTPQTRSALPLEYPPSKRVAHNKKQIFFELLLEHAIHSGMQGNWGRTRYYLRRYCRNTKKRCYWYARWVHKTLQLWQRSCGAGDPVACHWSAKAKRNKWREARFFRRAKPIYEAACLQGEVKACVALGRVNLDAHKAWQPTQEERRWLKRACQLGAPKGCLGLGVFYSKAAAPGQQQKALRYFRRTCQLQAPAGCIAWGQRLLATNPKGRQAAHQAFHEACKLHHKWGCRLAKHVENTLKK